MRADPNPPKTRRAAIAAAATNPDAFVAHSTFAHSVGIAPRTFAQFGRENPEKWPRVIVRGPLMYAKRSEFETFLESLRETAE